MTSGWLFDKDLPFTVPTEVTVGLMGFNSDGYKEYRLDTAALGRYLQNSMESHVPACMETRRHMSVQFDLTYDIVQVSSDQLRQYEDAVTKGMRFVAKRTEDSFYYDVDVAAVTEVLDSVYESLLAGKSGRAHNNAIIIVNPNPQRLRPPTVQGKAPRDWSYRFRYADGTPTQTWIARQRYLVVDLGAGPCEYGVTNAGEGTVSMDSIPNLERLNEKELPRHHMEPGKTVSADDAHELSHHIRFLAQLSSLVLTGVRHVFLPDMRFETIDYAEKVIVPVMVFRNHDRFNPLAPPTSVADAPFHIDIASVKRELQTLMAPSQELVVTTGVYDLHRHRQVSTALFRSLRGDSIHTATPSGHYVAKTVSYFDSSVLIDGLSRTEDFLTKAFMNTGATERTGHHSAGHRVLPVYVFSVLGFPNDVLFDRQMLHVATKECVVVLQTGNKNIFIPFFNEAGILSLDARQATRQVLAGAVSALGGVMHPFQRYIAKDHELVADYMWANGHHPFGPFTNTMGVSTIYADIVRRNSILSRVTTAFRLIRRAMSAWDAFTREYLFNPLGDSIEYDGTNTASASVLTPMQMMANKLQFWHATDENGNAPLSKLVMARLLKETSDLETQFTRLADLLRANAWDDADALSGLLEKAADGFVTYATDEINASRRNLRCCKRVHRVIHDDQVSRNRYFKWIFIVLGGVGVFVLIQSGLSASSGSSFSSSGGGGGGGLENKFSRVRRY